MDAYNNELGLLESQLSPDKNDDLNYSSEQISLKLSP
jgi:hypothetical protein